MTAKKTEWHIKCNINCKSTNVIYYLVCNCCDFTSKTGKTNILRSRMNCHISEIRTGNTSDKFDKHVIECKEKHCVTKEPYFKIYAYIKLPHENLLLTYESHFHNLGFDTMN